jgi:demethylmenaquinone methyltransferase/2-methoxy-6-polyprenyl-1,4-benzoquinol methylase
MAQRFTLRIGDHLKTPETKRYYNEKVFTEIARKYDFITRALSFWRDSHWKRDLIASLPPGESPLCLDLACGTGDIAFLLAGKYPQGSIVGLDITESMLELARRRNTFPNVRFASQDMARIEFAAESVDIVTGGYALRNAPDLEVTVEGIRRVLKPGGVAAFLDFSKPGAKFPQRLEYWTLKLWTGFWGMLLHRNPEVYGYIAESLQCFPDRDRLRSVFRDRGFTVIASRRYFFGITELLVVRKAIGNPC